MTSSQPFVRLLLPLVGGILLTSFLYDQALVPAYWGVGAWSYLEAWLLLVCLGLLLTNKVPSAVRATLVYAALFLLGVITSHLKYSQLEQAIRTLDGVEYNAYIVELTSQGQKKRASTQFEAKLRAVRTDSVWKETDVKTLVSVAEDAKAGLKTGSVLLVKHHPFKRPAGMRNPMEFDYRQYLERRGIAWTVFLPEESFVQLPSTTESTWLQWPATFYQKADSVFRHSLTNTASYGLVKAMLLGSRDDLGEELLTSYITAGAVHVLSVSGLHVGILYLFLFKITGRLRKSRRGHFIYLGLVFSFLTFYAILTGLSPSVLRASLMCATFAMAGAFNRQHHSLNTLALSAFIILIFDPQALFAVGFLLSYAAVLGIILLYPLLKNAIVTPYKAVRWLWQITLIGFTAQLFTFPISIYFFHQFPTYFWLVNPFVILLTSFLIYGAIGLLLFSFLSLTILAEWTAWGLDLVAQLTNYVVGIPRKLPVYLIENQSLDLLEVVLLSVLLLCVYQMLKKGEYGYLKGVFLLSLLFCQYGLLRTLSDFNTSSLYVHAVPRHTVLTLTHGQRAYVFADDAFRSDSVAFKFHLSNYFARQGIRTLIPVTLPDDATPAPWRLTWNRGLIGVNTQNLSGTESWTIVRKSKYPPPGYIPPGDKGLYILSPELGFRTRNRWAEVLSGGGRRYYLPMEEGALRF
jgi:competence protein ComEC